MNQLRVSTRLILLVAVLAVLTLAIGALGLFEIRELNRSMKSVYEDRTVPLSQLGAVRDAMQTNQQSIVMALLDPSPANVQARLASVDEHVAAISKQWDAYMAIYLTPEEKKLAEQFVRSRAEFVSQVIQPSVAALKAGDTKTAQLLALGKGPQLYAGTERTLDALVQLQIDEARKLYEEAEASFRSMLAIVVGTLLAGLGFAGVFGWLVVRSIVRQLGGEPAAVVDIAQAIAHGDLSRPIQAPAGAEHSIVAAMAEMQARLTAMVGQVRDSSESIATGSAQIASGNADLSQRTEEQASNLQQTAASMEQLTGTVKASADTALQANRLAATASEAAAQGGASVGQVVTTMQQIAEASKRIADIIGVIDGIAFQTNILALNAAVEAARAGEQGRGFAVVASEVRSLAQRSAEAAREIKALIGTSTERVDAGTRQVALAGESMDNIVAQVRRVSQMIGEISGATVEQTAGIGQIGDAVNQLDQVTQQNAALVEESAAAAESLKAQSLQLAELVGRFRLR